MLDMSRGGVDNEEKTKTSHISNVQQHRSLRSRMLLNGARLQRCSASRSRELATSPNNASPVRCAHQNFASSPAKAGSEAKLRRSAPR